MDRRQFLWLAALLGSGKMVEASGLSDLFGGFSRSHQYPVKSTLEVCNQENSHPVVRMKGSDAEQRMRQLSKEQDLEDYWAYFRTDADSGVLVDFGYRQTPFQASFKSSLMTLQARRLADSGYPALSVTSYHLHTDYGVRSVWSLIKGQAPRGHRTLDDVNFAICALPSSIDLITDIDVMDQLHDNGIPYEGEKVVSSRSVFSFVPTARLQSLYRRHDSDKSRLSHFDDIVIRAVDRGIASHSLQKALEVYQDAGVAVHFRWFQ